MVLRESKTLPTIAATVVAAAAKNETDDGDDEVSSTRCSPSRLLRKRKRLENIGATNEEEEEHDNQYCGWTVPDTVEGPFRIPTIIIDHQLTPELFYQKYVRRRRPVVIRGLEEGRFPNELSHLEKWTASNDDLLRRAGEEVISVEKRSTRHASFGKGNEVSMPFRTFLKHMEENGDTLHYLTTQDVEANDDGRPELMSPFMEKLRRDGGEKKDKQKKRDDGDDNGQVIDGDDAADDTSGAAFPLVPKIVGNLIPQNINLWMGNSHNSTGASSGLHHDYHDNLYIVLRGTKKFRLYSPADTELMYTRGELERVHPNGRINYVNESTTAYGADPMSHASAEAAKMKDIAEERLASAELAVEKGHSGADDALEEAEALLEKAMEAILDAETGGGSDEDEEDDDDNVEEEFCLETATEEDGQKIKMDWISSVNNSTDDEEDDDDTDGSGDTEPTDECDNSSSIYGRRRIVDKTIKNPNNFSLIDPSVLDDEENLRSNFPKILNAKAAFCECSVGDILYLPASWFHEVTSSSSSRDDERNNSNASGIVSSNIPKGHIAFNYWFHPPDAENDFENPYTTSFWSNDFKDRFK